MAVDGLPEFRRRMLQRIPAAVTRAAAQAMEEKAEQIKTEMIRRAPEDEGDLKRSIRWSWRGGSPTFSVTRGGRGAYASLLIDVRAGDENTIVTNKRGQEFQNARLQEFGTAKMPPTPYFFGTWRRLKRSTKSLITSRIKRALRRT